MLPHADVAVDADKGPQNSYSSITKVFPTARSLLQHLLQVLPEDVGKTLIQTQDSSIYISLLHHSMVVGKDGHQMAAITNAAGSTGTPLIREVLSNVVAQITRAANALQLAPKDQNVLCLGYRRKAVNASAVMRNHIDIECYSINTIQTLLITPAWQLLLNRIGK